MSESPELGKFLRLRRAALQPEEVGLRVYGPRRVPGLRREELAMLAGVSSTYYTRLEQGSSLNASDAVIDSIARALNLNEDERVHLFDLARPSRIKRRAPVKADQASPNLSRLVQTMHDTPAVILGRRSEILGWNNLGHRLVAGHLSFEAPAKAPVRPNMVRMLFLDQHTRELYASWTEEARRAVCCLHMLAARHPHDPEMTGLVGELTLGSAEFAHLWAKHPVENCSSGVKHLHHPEVGAMDLFFNVLTPTDGSEHRLLMFSADAGSTSSASLQLLASTRHAPVPHRAPIPSAI